MPNIDIFPFNTTQERELLMYAVLMGLDNLGKDGVDPADALALTHYTNLLEKQFQMSSAYLSVRDTKKGKNIVWIHTSLSDPKVIFKAKTIEQLAALYVPAYDGEYYAGFGMTTPELKEPFQKRILEEIPLKTLDPEVQTMLLLAIVTRHAELKKQRENPDLKAKRLCLLKLCQRVKQTSWEDSLKESLLYNLKELHNKCTTTGHKSSLCTPPACATQGLTLDVILAENDQKMSTEQQTTQKTSMPPDDAVQLTPLEKKLFMDAYKENCQTRKINNALPALEVFFKTYFNMRPYFLEIENETRLVAWIHVSALDDKHQLRTHIEAVITRMHLQAYQGEYYIVSDPEYKKILKEQMYDPSPNETTQNADLKTMPVLPEPLEALPDAEMSWQQKFRSIIALCKKIKRPTYDDALMPIISTLYETAYQLLNKPTIQAADSKMMEENITLFTAYLRTLPESTNATSGYYETINTTLGQLCRLYSRIPNIAGITKEQLERAGNEFITKVTTVRLGKMMMKRTPKPPVPTQGTKQQPKTQQPTPTKKELKKAAAHKQKQATVQAERRPKESEKTQEQELKKAEESARLEQEAARAKKEQKEKEHAERTRNEETQKATSALRRKQKESEKLEQTSNWQQTCQSRRIAKKTAPLDAVYCKKRALATRSPVQEQKDTEDKTQEIPIQNAPAKPTLPTPTFTQPDLKPKQELENAMLSERENKIKKAMKVLQPFSLTEFTANELPANNRTTLALLTDKLPFNAVLEIYGSYVAFLACLRLGISEEEIPRPKDIDLRIRISPKNADCATVTPYIEALIAWKFKLQGYQSLNSDTSVLTTHIYKHAQRKGFLNFTLAAKEATDYPIELAVYIDGYSYRHNTNPFNLLNHTINLMEDNASFDPKNLTLKRQLVEDIVDKRCRMHPYFANIAHNVFNLFTRAFKNKTNWEKCFNTDDINIVFNNIKLIKKYFSIRFESQAASMRKSPYLEFASMIQQGYFFLSEAQNVIKGFIMSIFECVNQESRNCIADNIFPVQCLTSKQDKIAETEAETVVQKLRTRITHPHDKTTVQIAAEFYAHLIAILKEHTPELRRSFLDDCTRNKNSILFDAFTVALGPAPCTAVTPLPGTQCTPICTDSTEPKTMAEEQQCRFLPQFTTRLSPCPPTALSQPSLTPTPKSDQTHKATT